MVFELSSAQARALVNTPCYQASRHPAHWGVTLPAHHSTARKTLDQLGFVDYIPLVALRVAEPLAMLMARGAWKTLSLACSDTWKDRAGTVKVLACASSLFQSVPEQVRKQKLAYGRAAEASDAVAQFDLCHFPSELHLAADKLTEWAPAILSKHVQDSATLTFLVDRLRTAASSLERPVGRNREHGGGRRKAYSIEKIIRCVCTSGLLSADRNLRVAVEQSVRLVASETMGNYIMAMSVAASDMPSPATLSRARLTVDCGYMRWCQKRVRQPSLVVPFLLCDSSPQANKDWVLAECRLLTKEVAIKVFRAVQLLFETKDESDPTVDRAALFAIVDEGCARHMYPPGAVGSRRASLLHKLHAVLHSMRLEMGSWAAVKAWASEVFSFTTDAGVEKGLAGVTSPHLAEFFLTLQTRPCRTLLMSSMAVASKRSVMARQASSQWPQQARLPFSSKTLSGSREASTFAMAPLIS